MSARPFAIRACSSNAASSCSLVFAAFILHSILHIEPSVVALLGAGVLILISRLERSDYLASVEWETLLFFAGLFVMVGALVKTGVVEQARAIRHRIHRRKSRCSP